MACREPAIVGFRVVAAPDPFRQERVEKWYPVGTRLDEVIRDLQPEPVLREHVTAFVETSFVHPELLHCVKPKAGAHVYIKMNPGASAVVAIVAAVAANAASSALVAAGFSALTSAIVGALVSTAIGFVGNMLFAPSAPNKGISGYQGSGPGSPKESPTFSITNARNSARPFDVVPRVLGKHKMVPPYGAQPYTEVVGDYQYLRIVVVWGHGPCRVTELKIGETPIDDFEDVEYETVSGAVGDPALTLYPDTVRQQDLSVLLTETFASRTTAIETDELGATLTFPQGLVKFDGNNRKNYSVRVIGEYKLTNDSTWTAWFDETLTDNTAQVKRYTPPRVTVNRGQYDVRVRRGDAQSTNSAVRDRASWSALRAFKNEDPIGLDQVCATAVRIKASDQLNGVVDQLNGVVEALVPTYNGTDWSADGYSRNPADLFRYVLTGRENKSALAASSIDDTSLAEWHDFCAAQGYTYDRVLDAEISVIDLLNEIAQAGRAAPNVIDGKWGVIIDKTRPSVIQHFTPRNSWDFQGERVFTEQPHALRVRFMNEERGYREDERIVYDDGYDSSSATVFERLELVGVTDPDLVWKHARYIMGLNRLRPEFFSFKVDFEHLVATRGDLIRINHDVPIIGAGFGRVSAVSGQAVTLDDEVTLTIGNDYAVRFRLSNGASLLRTVVVSATETTKTINLDPADSDISVPVAGDLYMFGQSGEDSLELIIHSIQPQADLSATVICQPYSPALFDLDGGAIPAYSTVLSEIETRVAGGPADPIIEQVVSDEKALVLNSDGSLQIAVDVYFQSGTNTSGTNNFRSNPTDVRARFRRSNTTDPWSYVSPVPFDARSIKVPGVSQGAGYDVAIQAIDSVGRTSSWVQSGNHIVVGTSTKPDPVDTFSLATIGDHTFVEWTYNDPPIDLDRFEIRYHPNQSITDWAAFTVLSKSIAKTERSFTVPSRSGSYAIKPIDIEGNRSATALFVNASLEDPESLNVIETYTEDPTFAGAKTSVVEFDGKLQLDSAETMSDWTTLADVLSLSYGVSSGFQSSGAYEFANGPLDLGEVYTSRVSADVTAGVISLLNRLSTWDSLSEVDTLAGEGVADAATVRPLIAYSADDTLSPTFTAWQPLVVGDYTARHIKFGAELSTTEAGVSPFVDGLTVNIDMPDRVATGEDVASGTSTKSIAFSPYFRALKSVNITGQDLQQGDYWNVTNKSRSGFDITFRNSSGAIVSRTFDWQAVGYGRERGT